MVKYVKAERDPYNAYDSSLWDRLVKGYSKDAQEWFKDNNVRLDYDLDIDDNLIPGTGSIRYKEFSNKNLVIDYLESSYLDEFKYMAADDFTKMLGRGEIIQLPNGHYLLAI